VRGSESGDRKHTCCHLVHQRQVLQLRKLVCHAAQTEQGAPEWKSVMFDRVRAF